MSNNHSLAPRVLEPECGRYAALLPVLDEAGTDPAEAAQAREHVAGCARCQAELAAYSRLEGALRRHFGPEAAPRLSTADLLWSSTGLPLEDIMHDVPDTTPSTPSTGATTPDLPDRPAFPALPSLTAYRSRGPRRLISAVAAIAAVLAIAVTAQVLFTGSHSHSTGTTRPHATATTTPIYPPFDQLTSIVAVSSTEAWAAGSGGTFNISAPPYLLHETNGRWQQVPLSCQCPGGIVALSMVNSTDIWAVGERGLVLHYDGHTWTQLPSPTDPTDASGPHFTALDMVSATEGWAVAQSDTLWHYHNGTWSQVIAPTIPGTTPDAVQLESISMIAANVGWAAGQVIPQNATTNGDGTTTNPGQPTGVILHYSGGRWSVQGAWPNAIIHAVAMTSADAGWAGGENEQQITYPGLPTAIPPIPASTSTVVTPLLLRYQHGSWQVAANPVYSPDYSKGSLTAMAMRSPDEGWALESLTGSFSYNANAASVSNLLLHYHNGAWSEVELPLIYNRDSAPVGAMSVTPQGDLWLAGSAWWPRDAWMPAGNGGYAPKVTALILRYSQGTWTVVES